MPKRVVVIGNGAAGSKFTALLAALAKKNKKDYSITVLSPENYSEISLQMTSVLATGSEEHNKALFPLVQEDGVEYILEGCKDLNGDNLITTSGRAISFDVCVVASGLNFPIFMHSASQPTLESRKEFIKEMQDKIKAANTLVLSGGGPVGCELASDIKIRYPEKRVILVCSQSEILDSMSPSLRRLAKSAMERQKVEFIMNDKVTGFENNQATTKNGQSINCDLYIPCHSRGPNTQFAPPSMKNEAGYITVNDCLRSVSNDKVFAVGDCSSHDNVKIYPKIDDQMPTIIKNVVATLEGHALTPHKKTFYSSIKGPMAVSLGHGHPDGYGVGPDLPGCLGCVCWTCCCFGMPCSPPAGKGVMKMKTDLNLSIKAIKGKGYSK